MTVFQQNPADNMTRKTIRVHPSSDALDSRLQEALAALTPVTFVSCSDLAECREGDALLNLSGNDDTLEALPAETVRCFHVANGITTAGARQTGGSSVQFSRSEYLDPRLHGRSLMHKAMPGYGGLRIRPMDEVLASCAGNPIWIVRNRRDSLMHVVSVPLPSLGPAETPFDYLQRERFFRLLPLLHFLREATAGAGWKNPPLRACVMIDDPNLHWMSYGFLRYEKLLAEAKSHGFHVAFATVPLDAWASHPGAVKLFRDHPEQFSLLVHGNNHSKQELSRSCPEEDYLRLAAQSLRRIDRLEKKTGVRVGRVMAPPHGACTSSCLAALLAVGFEGACATTSLLRKLNPHLLRDSSFGLKIAEIAPGFAPVIPRFKLDSSCEGAMVISAFLDKPIILVGHHHTAANGMELLTSAAKAVNSLGSVSWAGPESMLRSNFRSLQTGTTLWIEPYSCRLCLTVPPGINEVRLYRSEATSFDADLGFALISKQGTKLIDRQNLSNGSLRVAPGDDIELVSLGLGRIDYRRIKGPRFSLQAFPRRLLCELRDRSMPLIPADLTPKKWTSG